MKVKAGEMAPRAATPRAAGSLMVFKSYPQTYIRHNTRGKIMLADIHYGSGV